MTNVTRFGAFVDIGVHQDGLVHVSEISHRYIQDPSEALKAGQIVKVRVMNADAKAKRIALSIKALEAAPNLKIKHGAPPPRHQQQPKEPTMQDKMAALAAKFNRR